MKSRRAIAIACHIFALASSLLVKCSSTACKVSLIAFFFPNDLSMTYRCPPHERPGSSGQTCLIAATNQCVRFARSLPSRTPTFTYMCFSAQTRMGEGGGGTRVHAGRWHARRRLRGYWDRRRVLYSYKLYITPRIQNLYK
jgi:hypothetical protein